MQCDADTVGTESVAADAEACMPMAEVMLSGYAPDARGIWYHCNRNVQRFLADIPPQLIATSQRAVQPSMLPQRYRYAAHSEHEHAEERVVPTESFAAGDHVRHAKFGEGIVVSSRFEKGDEWVTVAFVGQGVKELIVAYAGLERG